MLLKLKNEIIYGPVQSRRLGRSLGLNILPGGKKVCCFDCLYCQYGMEKSKTPGQTVKTKFPTVNDVLSALEHALKELPRPPAYITFSGNGEATLHPGFPSIVAGVMELRDAYSPVSKTAILSNSYTVPDPVIRKALSRLDGRIMKLDAGTDDVLTKYSGAAPGVTLEDIVKGLEMLPDVTIQALFTKGPDGNFSNRHIDAWVGQLKRIAPIFVQVYSLARNSPTSTIEKLTSEELQTIGQRLKSEGIPAEVF